jgi:hypothetical protein
MPSTSVQTSPRGELVIRGARPEPDNHSRGSPSARRVNVTTVDELAVGHSGWPARSESTTQHLTLKTTSQPALEKARVFLGGQGRKERRTSSGPAAAIAQVGRGGALRHRLPRRKPRPTSAGDAVAFDRRRQPHLTNHIDAAISRFLDARSMARRAIRHLIGWSSGRAETTVSEDTSSNDPNTGRRSAPRGRWRDRLESSGSSSTASLVRSGLRSFGWRTCVRAGMEVMSTEDDH